MKAANGDGANATHGYARLHKDGLTLPQQNAVDQLAAGKNDTETAEVLGLHRVTVTRWRLYDPAFQAELNRRRAELWGSAIDRFRSLVPKALAALDKALTSGHLPAEMKAAAEVSAPGPVAERWDRNRADRRRGNHRGAGQGADGRQVGGSRKGNVGDGSVARQFGLNSP